MDTQRKSMYALMAMMIECTCHLSTKHTHTKHFLHFAAHFQRLFNNLIPHRDFSTCWLYRFNAITQNTNIIEPTTSTAAKEKKKQIRIDTQFFPAIFWFTWQNRLLLFSFDFFFALFLFCLILNSSVDVVSKSKLRNRNKFDFSDEIH